MNRSRFAFAAVLASAVTAVSPEARASDRLVDATGAHGAYTTIDDAMDAASAGDRILVMPGKYPRFDFLVGVSVIGLGADPSEVVIPDVYVHVNHPKIGYDAVLQNVTLHSDDPAATLLLYGNENGPGSFTLDGVRVDGGGVYLRGGDDGFFVHVSNCDIVPKQGYGFSGEACFVGGDGTYVEIRNTRIRGWDALPYALLPAGVALRLFGGSHARIVGSDLRGGDGVADLVPAYGVGGTAIAAGLSGDVDLLLNGGTVVTGGTGVGAAGGGGVALRGSIFLGSATVSGGAGTPSGADFPLDPAVDVTTDLNLTLDPALEFAEGTPFVVSGQSLSVSMHPGNVSAILLGFAFDVPASSKFFSLSPSPGLLVIPGTSLSGTVPSLPGFEERGLMLCVQGLLLDPITGKVRVTNAATIRVDLQ